MFAALGVGPGNSLLAGEHHMSPLFFSFHFSVALLTLERVRCLDHIRASIPTLHVLQGRKHES